MNLGILVIGDNHFIVEGPKPNELQAQDLARQWSLIEIGGGTKPPLPGWAIRSKAFREDLEWAVVVAADCEHSPAVEQLLEELRARGVEASHV